MKLLHFFTLFILLTTSLFAKTHEGKFEYTTFEYGFTTNIEVKYKIWTLYGEPVVNTVARYKIVNGFISIDGHSYNLSEFPKTVMEKVRLYKLELKVDFETTYSTGTIVFIDVDMGAMGDAGKWSFNTPASPKWSKWIYYANYFSKERAIKAYKGFKKLESCVVYTKNIKYDITALKRYVSKQKLEKEKQRLKEEYTAKTEDLNQEIEKLYDIDKKNTSRLKEKYGDESLYQVMKRLQKGNNKEELSAFMKVLEASDKLALKVKPLREKINLITEKHEKIEKKFEDEYAYAILKIDKELKEINHFIDEKIVEVENRELPQNQPIKQEIKSSLMLLIDASGSMEGRKFEVAKKAAISNVKKAISKNVEVAVAFFGGSCSDPNVLNVHDFTLNSINLVSFIQNAPTMGGTPLSVALKQANEFLYSSKDKNSKNETILLLGDGEGNCANIDEVINELKVNKTYATHQTIGLEVDSHSKALRQLTKIATSSGGSYHQSVSVKDLEQIFEDLSDIEAIDNMIGRFGKNYNQPKDISNNSMQSILDNFE